MGLMIEIFCGALSGGVCAREVPYAKKGNCVFMMLIDPIHFGLIMTLNLMIGLLHPPLGMVLFVLARVAKLSVERTTMAILPWLVPLLLALVAITYIPELTLWLPKYMGLSR